MRKRFLWCAAGIAAVVLFAAGGVFAGNALTSRSEHSLKVAIAAQKAATASERQAIYSTCRLENLGRVTSNRNSYQNWKIETSEIALLGFFPNTGRSREAHRAFALIEAVIASMRDAVVLEAWTPLANCAQATNHPGTYVPPLAVPFTKEPPPPSAFTVGPNE